MGGGYTPLAGLHFGVLFVLLACIFLGAPLFIRIASVYAGWNFRYAEVPPETSACAPVYNASATLTLQLNITREYIAPLERNNTAFRQFRAWRPIALFYGL